MKCFPYLYIIIIKNMKHKILQRDLQKYDANPELLNAITLTTGKLETGSCDVAEKLRRIIIWDGRGNWMNKCLPKIAENSKIKFLDSGFTLTLKSKARNGETIKINYVFDNRGNQLKEEIVGVGIALEYTYDKLGRVKTNLRVPIYHDIDEVTNKVKWIIKTDCGCQLNGPGISYTEYTYEEGVEEAQYKRYHVNSVTGEKTLILTKEIWDADMANDGPSYWKSLNLQN